MPTVYIAGPMRGLKNFNFPAFDEARDRAELLGWKVISPADLGRAIGFDEKYQHVTITPDMLRDFATRDLSAILEADGIALLPGWENSAGARAEKAVAEWLELAILDARTLLAFPKAKPETVCQEAQRICYGDRNDDYGHPLDECEHMARLWGVILGTEPTAEQVCLCLIQMKISRLIHGMKRDSIVDICGYGECLNRIIEERARRDA